MRFSPLTFAALLAIPAGVFALNYSDATSVYTDASTFSRSEKAAISLLTNLEVVAGNDDGTFAPGRTLNRAEFAKIVINLQGGTDGIPAGETNCFPDVRSADWFSTYVCAAKSKGIVKGNPDGTFAPARSVNYAEAVKMLVETFDEVPRTELRADEQWYAPYLRDADNARLSLSGLRPGDFLTRGQMARLAAAFRAYADGELSMYRQAEQGKMPSSSSSISSSKAQWATCPDGYQYQTHAEDGSVINYFADPCLTHRSSSSSVSSVSSAPPASSTSSHALYPAVSRFLTADVQSPVLLDGTFVSRDEDGELRFVTVTLRNEVKSLSGMILVDGSGNEIGALKLALDDEYDRIWKGEYASGGFVLRKGVPVTLGVKVKLKKDEVHSAELFETEDIRLQLQGKTSNTAVHLAPTTGHYPSHQVALARLQSVKNAGEASGTLQSGLRRQIASFAFSGAVVTPGGTIRLEQLTFGIQSSGLALSNFKVGGTAEIQQTDCGIDTSAAGTLSCSLIPEAVNTVSGTRVLHVFANVTVLSGSTVPSLQLTLPTPGSMNVSGAVRWTDGAGRFNWTEGPTPLAAGTKWTVVK